MKTISFTSKTPAKVNLSLCITGKCDNLHTLDMIVYPVDFLYDEVIFTPSSKEGIDKVKVLYGYKGLKKRKFAKAMMIVANKIASELKIGGNIYIKKDIPLGAGLGGSSACIVSMLKSMQAYCEKIGIEHNLSADFLLSLGSDVPCMYKGGVLRVQGKGEIITPLENYPYLDINIAIAKGGSSTKDCYTLYDELNALDMIEHNTPPTTVDEAIKKPINDLIEPARILNPNIEKTMIALYNHTKSPVFMSGSGSAVFTISKISDYPH